MVTATKDKCILVTGGNAVIGYALCRQLVVDFECKVYMGAKSAERGKEAIIRIKTAHPEVENRLELVVMDVCSDKSVTNASENLKAKGVVLFALVNNAGIGFQTGHRLGKSVDELLATNFYGVKRVSDSFAGMIQPGGRIVNVSSSGASEWVISLSSKEKRALYTNSTTTWEQLVAAVESDKKEASLVGEDGGYCLSKAGVTAYTLQQSKLYQTLVCVSLNPGFIQTNMSNGYGAILTAEEGTVSLKKCIFADDIISGYYYGSDGVGAPLTVAREPGMPEYQGEQNPDTLSKLF